MNNTKDESIGNEKMEIYPPSICTAIRNMLIDNKYIELIVAIIVFELIMAIIVVFILIITFRIGE